MSSRELKRLMELENPGSRRRGLTAVTPTPPDPALPAAFTGWVRRI